MPKIPVGRSRIRSGYKIQKYATKGTAPAFELRRRLKASSKEIIQNSTPTADSEVSPSTTRKAKKICLKRSQVNAKYVKKSQQFKNTDKFDQIIHLTSQNNLELSDDQPDLRSSESENDSLVNDTGFNESNIDSRHDSDESMHFIASDDQPASPAGISEVESETGNLFNSASFDSDDLDDFVSPKSPSTFINQEVAKRGEMNNRNDSTKSVCANVSQDYTMMSSCIELENKIGSEMQYLSSSDDDDDLDDIILFESQSSTSNNGKSEKAKEDFENDIVVSKRLSKNATNGVKRSASKKRKEPDSEISDDEFLKYVEIDEYELIIE